MTVKEAARAGDVVIVTIPLKNIPRLPRGPVRGRARRRGRGGYRATTTRSSATAGSTPIEKGTTESRWVADQLGRPVVKAFNNIYARHLLERGKPKGAAGRIALPVAGDDRRAKDVVIRLLDELGFDGVDAGSLDESWRQQPGTPVYGTDLDAEGVRRGLAEAKPERKPEFSAGGTVLAEAD